MFKIIIFLFLWLPGICYGSECESVSKFMSKCSDSQKRMEKEISRKNLGRLSTLNIMLDFYSNIVDFSDEYMTSAGLQYQTRTTRRVEVLRRQALILKDLTNTLIKLEYENYASTADIIQSVVDEDLTKYIRSLFSKYKNQEYINKQISNRFYTEQDKMNEMYQQILKYLFDYC